MLTVTKAAKIANVHPSTVLHWIHDGFLPAAKLGQAYAVKKSDLASCLENRSKRKGGRTKKNPLTSANGYAPKATKPVDLSQCKEYVYINTDGERILMKRK